MPTGAKWRNYFTIISSVLPIPGQLIVPDCSCPGRGTHTRHSATVPGIPGQLVTLSHTPKHCNGLDSIPGCLGATCEARIKWRSHAADTLVCSWQCVTARRPTADIRARCQRYSCRMWQLRWTHTYRSRIVLFVALKKLDISQLSVATHLSCGVIFGDNIITHFLLFLLVKKFRK